MVTLTTQQAQVLYSFCEAFDILTTGVWQPIEEEMKRMGFEDPENELEDAKQALQKG